MQLRQPRSADSAIKVVLFFFPTSNRRLIPYSSWRRTSKRKEGNKTVNHSASQRCPRLSIGPQQGHCSAVSSSILRDWWSRPWPGLKGTLSPPMKREISPPILVGWPTNREELAAWHFIFFPLLLHFPAMTPWSSVSVLLLLLLPGPACFV